MNVGFSNLATLKANILGPDLAARDDWNTQIKTIGLMVAGHFERFCNRDFMYTEGAKDVTQGDREFFYVRRSPVAVFTKTELRYFKGDVWTDISGQPLAADEEKGMIHFGYTLGRRPMQVRVTYSGGYLWEQKETADIGYPTPVPDSVTNNAAGIDAAKFNLPPELFGAWILQVRKVWEAIDKQGTQITSVGSNTRNPSEALAGLDLVPEVKGILQPFIRYQLT